MGGGFLRFSQHVCGSQPTKQRTFGSLLNEGRISSRELLCPFDKRSKRCKSFRSNSHPLSCTNIIPRHGHSSIQSGLKNRGKPFSGVSKFSSRRTSKLVLKIKLDDSRERNLQDVSRSFENNSATSTKDGHTAPQLGSENPTVDTLREVGRKGGEEVLGKDLKARIWLLLVPFMWGTYGPALRFIYQQPVPPSASIITLSRKVASVVFFLLLLPLEKTAKKSSTTESHQGHSEGGVVAGNEAAEGSSKSTWRREWSAAAELGFWTFLGTALQTNALQSTTATRAGFIMQTITVLVPLLSAASGAVVSKTTWGAAFLALTGVFLMSVFGNEGSEGISNIFCSAGSPDCQSASLGDLGILAAAFFYAINTVRLGVHAKNIPALRLSTQVMVVSTVCTLGWAGFDFLSASLEGRDGGLAWEGLNDPLVAGAIVYSALVPGTLAHLAQAVGQRVVPASEAQVLYSLQPVWSAVFAAVVLHETMTPFAWGAGGIVVVAAVLASTQTFPPQKV